MYIKVGQSLQRLPYLPRLTATCRRISSYHMSVCRICIFTRKLILVCQHYTFYDFIINKARGKSGPLFSFDVHDDVRMLADATKEKDESHAGKVVERSWYQRNKHIFPASRWEVSLRGSFWCPSADICPTVAHHAALLVGSGV